MEVKAAYKHSEVGIVPSDWDEKPLGEILSSSPKNGHSGRAGSAARGTPTLRLTATTAGRLILNDSTIKHLDEVIDTRSDLFLKPGDVLIQRSNTLELVGTTAVFDGPLATFVYPDLLIRVRFHDETTALWFWRYANSERGRRFFVGAAAGSTGSMPKITGKKLLGMMIPLPPFRERQAIVATLSEIDNLIGSLDRLIAKKRDLKQAVMQQLLTGKRRLPGFADGNEGLMQSDAGEIPADWAVDKIANLARITTGSRDTQDREEGGAYPFFVRSSIVERINSYSFDGEAVLTAGDGVGTGKVFHYINGKCDFHQRVYKISDFAPRLHGRFFFLVFSTRFYDRIMSMTAKSSVDSVRMDMIAEMRIPLPSQDEQLAIALVLSDIDSEIASLEQKRDKTRDLKQGMMQELLTGKTRLV